MLLQTFKFYIISSFHFYLMINTVVYYTLQIVDSDISVLYAEAQKVSMIRKYHNHTLQANPWLIQKHLYFSNLIIVFLYVHIADIIYHFCKTSRLVIKQPARVYFRSLFVLLLYVPSQQLWSWRDGQFT